MKFILKNYIKNLYKELNNEKFTIKTIAKYHLRKQNYLYNFDLFIDGVFYDNINVFLTNERNQALNRSRGFDLNASCNGGVCLHQNECKYFVYNEPFMFGHFH